MKIHSGPDEPAIVDWSRQNPLFCVDADVRTAARLKADRVGIKLSIGTPR